MDLETIKSINPVFWFLGSVLLAVCAFVILNKTVMKLLKVGVVIAVILAAVYYLLHTGIIEIPRLGK